MSENLWLLLAAALSFAGMTWLALAMDVHWGQVMHQGAHVPGHHRLLLRAAGTGGLLLSLLACLLADRPSMAALVWIMLLACSGFAVAMLLSRRPRWLAPLARGVTSVR